MQCCVALQLSHAGWLGISPTFDQVGCSLVDTRHVIKECHQCCVFLKDVHMDKTDICIKFSNINELQ